MVNVMISDVFISYSSTYRQLVDALVHFLEEKQIKCWYAPRDIPHGIEYAEAIESAIANSNFFIILVSELSQESPWCRSEVNLAVSLGKIILPVRIEEVELKSGMKLYLNHRHWLDAFPRPEEYFENVCNAILELKKNTGARKIGGDDSFKGTVDHNEITPQSNPQEASTDEINQINVVRLEDVKRAFNGLEEENFHICGAIPAEKLENAKEGMGITEPFSDILCLYDSCYIFTPGDTGWAIVSTGLYVRGEWKTPRFFRWNEIKSVGISNESLKINDYIGPIIWGDDEKMAKVISAINRLVEIGTS